MQVGCGVMCILLLFVLAGKLDEKKPPEADMK